MPPAEPSAMAALKGVLQIRPFRRLWLVLGLSSLGDWLGLLASAVFAGEQVTGSAAKGAAFGSIVAVRMLPALIMGPLAGVVADRWNRRLTMVICDLGRFFLFASIPAITLVSTDPKVTLGWAAVATFIIESLQMGWGPAKDAAVPNLLPRERLEAANQLTLATTYGITPVLAGVGLAVINSVVGSQFHSVNPSHLALYFNALTFLANALTVFFGIKEISGHSSRRVKKPSVWREFIAGFAYVGKTRLVRGLVVGIFCAFAVAGMVVGSAQSYARSISGGDSTFYILFAFIFVGLAIGITAGPKLVGELSRRRWFPLSIMFAALSVTVMAVAWHLVVAVIATIGVGIGAGMALLAGTTLLGREVGDELRGRVFSFIQVGTQLALLFSVSLSSVITGLGSSRKVFGFEVSMTRPLLFAAGVLGLIAGIGALRQMDDKKGVPLLRDLVSSIRGRPLPVVGDPATRAGVFIVFEGIGALSAQVQRLAADLREAGHEVVVTHEPGATEIGGHIADLLADPATPLEPRAEVLLELADRAHHVATVLEPALARGAVVISDRYADSSLARHTGRGALPIADVRWLSRWATDGLKPDLVVLLDRDLADADATDAGAAERVRYALLDLAATDPARYLVVDAAQPAESIAALVAGRVARLLPTAQPAATA